MTNTITIGSEEFKLKVTLGFYKKLSFPKSELNNIQDNAERLFESVKLAIYFGNKADKGWHCISDMEKEVTEEMLEDIDDGNIIEKISQAIIANFSDIQKKAIEEIDDESKKK